ncbi:MAG TPA: 1-deoxy-D-xylulose-5-phosphate reductoisomerase [Gemmatimonadetes bacterium]|nr:1-deoxy-D-xylulose-5-phosphate reductoisomerase [Gemmatimonadota bacterium]HAB29641.1 1-deoxy-D-xylulose-5-phosphate reductoisomerase [Gemmatimonadota bacterium]
MALTKVAILGSTGSIGRATLSVIARHTDRFQVVAVCAHDSLNDVAAQVEKYGVPVAVMADPQALNGSHSLPDAMWRSGRDAVLEVVEDVNVDVVVNAIVGSAGLEATFAALRAGKRLALANKESLVAGGPLVIDAAREGGGELIPIDSEHSAILQCLQAHDSESVARLVLTASGGPFRGLDAGELANVGPEDALRHPTWDMGEKITVDSATLANKALEIIEAHFLYGIGYDKIEAIVHPQSIVHSFVEFNDGSVLAQLGFPTMELPILYALSHPEHVADISLRTFDPIRSSPLTFEEIDRERFELFTLGVEAGVRGGTAPAVFNAANEIAVQAFLSRGIRFIDMPEVVAHALATVPKRNAETLDDVLEADAAARAAAGDFVCSRRSLTGG